MQVLKNKNNNTIRIPISLYKRVILLFFVFAYFTNPTIAQQSNKTLKDTTLVSFPDFNNFKILPFFSTIQNNKLLLPQSNYHWGAACKLEFKLEKKIKMPLKFRLGTLDYVNQLEGKGSSFRK